MKIRFLHLQNYRRHRDTRLEPGDGVIALLGRNGSGKSTLLEALGFAIYGVPATRTKKELLRFDGAPPGDPVRVVLEMDLDGHAITVARELRGKNLTPSASLTVDGQVQVQPGGSSNEAVTREMTHRLGMGQQSFFTTIVAKQKELAGLADQTAADRKRFLLSLLGVDRIDQAIQTARTNRRGVQARVVALQEDLPDLGALKKEVDGAEEQVSKAGGEVKARQAAHEKAEAAWKAASTRLESAREQDHERQQTEAAMVQARRDLDQHTKRLESAARDLEKAEAARQEVQALDSLDADLAAVETACRDAEGLHDAAARIEAERQALKEDESRLAALVKERDAIEPPPAPNGELERLEAEVSLMEKGVAGRRDEAAARRAELRSVEEQLHRIAELGPDAPCPTCQRSLSDHLPALRHELQQKQAASEQALATVHQEVEEASDRMAALRAQEQAWQERLRERERLTAERHHLQARIDDLATRVTERRERVAEVPDALPDLAPLREARDRLQALARKKAHAEAIAETAPRWQQAVQEARQAVEASRAEARAREETLARFPDTAKVLATAKKTHQEAEAAERHADRAVQEAKADVRVARERLDGLRTRQEQAKRLQDRLQEARLDTRYWTALAGERGGGLLDRFKDHIVQRIGPAISVEASRLLSRFTAGRYTEVLLDADYELSVADAGEHHPLERFSGGESDLVHLALRLAVSRLLVERAGGTDLRFLALDEVFGSLDRERRRSVLGALRELGGIYAQVLLVTHEEGLQDALDHAILVEERDGEAVIRSQNG